MLRVWKQAVLAALFAVAGPLGLLHAQQVDGPPTNDQLRVQLDTQAAQIRALQEQLDRIPSYSNTSLETASANVENKEAAAEAAAPKPYEVGSDLKMSARWNPASGVTFETPNKDFVSHIGVRFQLDFVGMSDSASLRNNPAFGTLEDGEFFRRLRPSWDGTAYDIMEWNIELALEQTQNNVPNLDQVWVGLKDIPFVNTVRIGHQKVPQGFEGDMTSSSKAMTFLERSAYTDAWYENFGTGFQIANHIAEDHVTYQAMAYRQDNAPDGNGNNTGADFNDGKWGYSARLTVLPFYQDDGRHMLHLGVSGTYRAAEDPTAGTQPNSDFRARPQMRDQIGATPLGNSNRLVDTTAINCDTNTVIGTELFYVLGPASLQAEYSWASMNDCIGGKVNQQHSDVWFNGGYIQGSYFLTGENRIYDRRFGTLGSDYIATPYTPFWLVRDANGDCCWGSGAWELAARANHLSLNNQILTAQGGELDGYEFGVNWYLNTNLKLQFEYLHEVVYGGGPRGDGTVDGFGMRTQFFF
ncbi:MAG TPA: porin [Pirellulales bacterium]|jgi:phosphate-selective porin OprO/OprP|nr:porin [Pirellulales bacterium]